MPKLKILVIAYYFPPAIAVAGQRVYSWCKYFPKAEADTVFVTRKWSDTDAAWSDLTRNVDGLVEEEMLFGNKVFRLPSQSITDKSIYNKFLMKFNLTNKIVRFLFNVFGYFNIETDAHISFKQFLLNYISKNKVDLIVVSSPPLNLARLAFELNKETGIPYHVDFRDLWNNGYLNENYNPSFSIALTDKLKKYYLKRWIKNARSVSVDSLAKADVLQQLYTEKMDVITNGFDGDLYQNKNNLKYPVFTITLSGTYYKQQPLDIFLDGMKLFLKNNPAEFQVILVGLEAIDTVIPKIKNVIPESNLKILSRITPEKNAEILLQSHVTFMPSWFGYKGLYTTKLFDMIASGSKILIAPGDHDVIDDTIQKTKTGEVVYTSADFHRILNSWYQEWLTNGFIHHNPDWKEINKFSRENTAIQLYNLLLKNYTEINNAHTV